MTADETSTYGDFTLMQNTHTGEAYFDSPGITSGLITEGNSYVFEIRKPVFGGEEQVMLPRINQDNPGNTVPQTIFSKYINEVNGVDLEAQEEFMLTTADTILLLLNRRQVIESIQNGRITDSRLISAFFMKELNETFSFEMSEAEEVYAKYKFIRDKVGTQNYGLQSNQRYTKAQKIESDEWMKTAVNENGEHFYENSKPEVLVVASPDIIFDPEVGVNLNARIILNAELSPAERTIQLILPGGSKEMFNRDKPFLRKDKTVDTELKDHVMKLRSQYDGSNSVGTAILELVQEAGMTVDPTCSYVTQAASIYAGLDTTNSLSELIMIERAVPTGLSRESADEKFLVQSVEFTLKEVLIAIACGHITDTRFVSAFAKVMLTKPKLVPITNVFEA